MLGAVFGRSKNSSLDRNIENSFEFSQKKLNTKIDYSPNVSINVKLVQKVKGEKEILHIDLHSNDCRHKPLKHTQRYCRNKKPRQTKKLIQQKWQLNDSKVS